MLLAIPLDGLLHEIDPSDRGPLRDRGYDTDAFLVRSLGIVPIPVLDTLEAKLLADLVGDVGVPVAGILDHLLWYLAFET